MAEVRDTAPDTAPGVLRSIGFFWWLLGVTLGALSIVSVVRSVYVDRPLAMPLQGTVDSHDALLQFLRQLTEPALQPLVHWFGSLFEWELTLQPHWPAMLLLFLVLIALTFIEDRKFDSPAIWTLRLGGRIVFGVLASLAAAVVPVDGPWWAQGAAAAFPPTIFALGVLVSNGIADAIQGSWQGLLYLLDIRLWRYELTVPFWGLFGLGAAATLLPPFETGAGIAALGAGLVFFALASLAKGERYIGLTVLAPFLGAGILYGLDWMIRAG